MQFLRRIILAAGVVAACAAPAGLRAEATNTPPDFKEVYDLVLTHLAGETATDLDRAAVTGLLNQLHAKISLVGNARGGTTESIGPLLAKATIFEGPVGYLRVGRVADGLAGEISKAYKDLTATNRLKGIVLDLRFADGHDYAAAAAAADLFVGKEMPLLDWGKGTVPSTAKPDPITVPVTVLVNQKTAAAAEALAAVLRQSDRALVLGANTAGEATMDQLYPLKNGQSLRIATASVKLGNGEALSANGITPDIQVAVSPEDEKAYYADPFREISKPSNLLSSLGVPQTNAVGGTNHARMRPTEADLIRDRKLNPGREVEYSVSPSREPEVEKPVVRDPVLARALDLLKVISVLHTARPA